MAHSPLYKKKQRIVTETSRLRLVSLCRVEERRRRVRFHTRKSPGLWKWPGLFFDMSGVRLFLRRGRPPPAGVVVMLNSNVTVVAVLQKSAKDIPGLRGLPTRGRRKSAVPR